MKDKEYKFSELTIGVIFDKAENTGNKK